MIKRFIKSPVVCYAAANPPGGEPVNRRAATSRFQATELTVDGLRDMLCELLDAARLTPEQKVELLGGAFVVEAVRPFTRGDDAEEAHERLRSADPELAEAVEALAPMIYGRARAAKDAVSAIAAIEEMLR
jgi:hypothetical protein